MSPRRAGTIRRAARGVAAVELALLLPVILIALTGVAEVARGIYTFNTLNKSVRDAARYMSQLERSDDVRQAAKCLAAHGNTTCSGAALAPDLNVSLVTVCDADLCADHRNQPVGVGVVNLVSVGIQGYTFDSIVEYVVGDIPFNRIYVTMRANL